LRSRGVLPPPVQVQRVQAVPRTALGKAPLIKRPLTTTEKAVPGCSLVGG
jgi:hypothetical protein